jgi:hypothetical protein
MKKKEPFFKKQGPAQAWMGGWALTDGHLWENGGSFALKIEISKVDQIVLKFMSDLFNNAKIYTYKRSNTSILAVHSKEVVEDLVSLGVPIGKKAHTVKPLNFPEEYMHHFWRGVIEGDGCLSFRRPNTRDYPFINLVGNYQVCEGFMDFMGFEGKISKNNNSFSIQKTSSDVDFWYEIKDLFYDEYTIKNNLFLPRKFAKICEIIESLENN